MWRPAVPASADHAVASQNKPRLLFMRFGRPNLPGFVKLHLDDQVRCLEQRFVVKIVDTPIDYDLVCDEFQPDLSLFESGVYVGMRNIRGINSHPGIPRLGFIHCDAYCRSRKAAIADMDRWGINQFVTTSVALPAHTPEIADRMFVWPNFVDPQIFKDFGLPKTIPILFTGSQASHYPWRNAAHRVLSPYFTHAQTPHFGWFETAAEKSRGMPAGEQYARLINSSRVAPTCGSVAMEVVRKHFEIPACRTCLITQRNPMLETAGFVDGTNCIFAEESDMLDRVRSLLLQPDECERIAIAGQRLVAMNHTASQRNQIAEWFDLHLRAGPRQRVVQANPFLPMSIVDTPSFAFSPPASAGRERRLLDDGAKLLTLGEHDCAEISYTRARNYHSTAEATIGLALCQLLKGNAQTAVRMLRKEIEYSSHPGNSGEPDPVEWAYLIVALLCADRTLEALAHAERYPHLRHPELDATRQAIRLIGDIGLPQGDAAPATTRRASLHTLGNYRRVSFPVRLARLLEACKQQRVAHLVRSSHACPVGNAGEMRRLWIVPLAHALSRTRSLARGIRNTLVRRHNIVCTQVARLIPSKWGRTNPTLDLMEQAVSRASARTALVIGRAASVQMLEPVVKALARSPVLTDALVLLCEARGNHPTQHLEGSPVIKVVALQSRAELISHVRQAVSGWRVQGGECELLAINLGDFPELGPTLSQLPARTVVLLGLDGARDQEAIEFYLSSPKYVLDRFGADDGYAVLTVQARQQHEMHANDQRSLRGGRTGVVNVEHFRGTQPT